MRRLVIATTLIICLALPAWAHAAAPRSFYGLIPATDPDSTEIARMGAGKVGTLRINFVWGAVQPSARAPPTTGATTTPSSARRPSRASGCCRRSTARRPGSRTERTSRRPDASGPLPGVRPGGRAALREQRHLLVQQPDDSEGPGDRLAALERDELAELLVPQAEREAVRRPCSRSSTAGIKSGDPSAKVVLGRAVPDAPNQERDPARPLSARPSTGRRARSTSTRRRCTPTRRPRRTL